MVADAVKWLCTSPRRLAVAVGGLILLIVIGGSMFNSRDAQNAAGPDPTPTSVSTATVPEAKPYVDAAVRFVDAWSVKRSGESETEWYQRVSKLTTPELSAALKETDTETLPGSPPSGSPVTPISPQKACRMPS